MKIKRKTHKKSMVFLVCLFLVISCLSLVYFFYYKNNSISTNHLKKDSADIGSGFNYTQPSSDEKTAGDTQKKQIVDNSQSDSAAAQPKSSALNVAITAKNQNGDIVQIRSIITEVIGGSCSLNITQGGTTKTYTASVQTLPSASTCTGFNIPVSDLQPGNWSFSLAVTSNDSRRGQASSSLRVH